MSGKDQNVQYHLIEGIRFPKIFPEENCRSALTYKPQPNDVFVVTYPKCGTNWLGQVVKLILQKGEPLKSEESRLVGSLLLEIAGADTIAAAPRPCVIKTHLPFRVMPWSEKAKYVYVARNPKDCCVSFYHHLKNMVGSAFPGSFDDFFELFISGKLGYVDYFDHLLEWYEHKNDKNVLFVTYESMKEKPKDTVFQIATFLGEEYAKPLNEDQNLLNSVIYFSSFDYMKENVNKSLGNLMSLSSTEMEKTNIPEGIQQLLLNLGKGKDKSSLNKDGVDFIRKGIIGDWKNHFSSEQNKRLNEKFLKRTEGTGIENLWESYM